MASIRELNSPDNFARLCKLLLSEEFADFQTVDDSGGDGGNDGYSERQRTLFQLYCPAKPEKAVDATYKKKIREDLEKAKRLADSGTYEIETWIFVTPRELREPVLTYLRTEAKAKGFAGVSWADPKLAALLAKHAHLRSEFPDLIAPDIEKQLRTGIQAASDTFASFQESIGSLVTANLVEAEHHAELDHAKGLLDQHRSKEALEYLEAQKDRIFRRADTRVRFRFLTNLAAAKAGLGDEVGAGTLFIEAYQFNTGDEKALCNRAIGHLLLGEREEASRIAQQVVERNPASERAHEVLIHCAAPEETLESLLKKVPLALRDARGVARAIARAAHLRGDWDAAIHWLETAISKTNGEDPDLNADLASTILESFSEREDVLTGGQVRAEDKAAIERAIALLTNAIAALSTSETIKFRVGWFVNRSTGYKLLGEWEKALVDIDRALELSQEPAFIKQKAILLHRKGESNVAIELLRRIVAEPSVPEVQLVLADVLRQRNEVREAEAVLAQPLPADAPAEMHEEKRRLVLQLAVDSGDIERARVMVESMRRDAPGSIPVLVDAAKVEKHAGNDVAVANLLTEAVSRVASGVPAWTKVELANALYVTGRYPEAASLYEQVADTRVASDLSDRLLISLHQSGEVDKVLQACRDRVDPGDALAAQFEFATLANCGDLDGAADVARSYLAVRPTDVEMRMRLAAVLFRSNRMNELDNVLDIEVDVSALSLDAGFHLAGALMERGKCQRALDLAYDLRRQYFDDGQAHLRYIGVFFDRGSEDEESLDHDTVEIGCAVRMQEDGSDRGQWYVLEDRKDATKARKELHADTPLARKLIDKRLGDEVVNKGGMAETRLKVVEIKSKYVYALHESLEMLPQIFPETHGLERFSVRTSGSEEELKEDLQVVFDLVARHRGHVDKMQGFYDEGRLPVESFAGAIGRNVIEVWGGLFGSKSGVRCCMGTADERSQAFKALQSCQAAVLDITALVTGQELGMLQSIKSVLGRCLVTQSTVDLVTQAILERKGAMADGFGTIYKEGDTFYRHEVTAEDVRSMVRHLEELRTWIDENCEKALVKTRIKFEQERGQKLEELLGRATLETMLAAKEAGCLIYSDDLSTRQLASALFGVQGTWTQALLLYGADRGMVSRSDVDKSTVSLSRWNFAYTTMTASALREAAMQSKWEYAPPLSNVVESFSGAHAELGSVLGVFAEFSAILWMEPLLDTRREALFVATLNAIARDSSGSGIAWKLYRLVQMRFRLNPIAGERVLQTLAAWRTLRR